MKINVDGIMKHIDKSGVISCADKEISYLKGLIEKEKSEDMKKIMIANLKDLEMKRNMIDTVLDKIL